MFIDTHTYVNYVKVNTREDVEGGAKDRVAKHVCQFQSKQNLTQILCLVRNTDGNASRCECYFGLYLCSTKTRGELGNPSPRPETQEIGEFI